MLDIERHFSAEDCEELRIRTLVLAGFAKLSSCVLSSCIDVLDGLTPKI